VSAIKGRHEQTLNAAVCMRLMVSKNDSKSICSIGHNC